MIPHPHRNFTGKRDGLCQVFIAQIPCQAELPYGLPGLSPVIGIKSYLVPHNEDPYIIEFPAQVFVLGGKRQKLRRAQFKATVVRMELNGNVIAYSYGLIPVTAHKKKKKWVITSEAACIFTATFIDDRGDGVFRILAPNGLTLDLVPQWALPKQIL